MCLHLEANLLFENNLDAEAAILLLFRAQVKGLLPVQVFPLTVIKRQSGLGATSGSASRRLPGDRFNCRKGFELF